MWAGMTWAEEHIMLTCVPRLLAHINLDVKLHVDMFDIFCKLHTSQHFSLMLHTYICTYVHIIILYCIVHVYNRLLSTLSKTRRLDFHLLWSAATSK